MTTVSLTPEPPSTPAAVFAGLLTQLAEAGRAPSEAPASPSTPEALAVALFEVAARAGVALFSVWAEEAYAAAGADGDVDGDEGGGAVPEPRVDAGISLFFDTEASAEQVAVRQSMASTLYRPLGQALAAHARRGEDPKLPQRGVVSFPAGAVDPDLEFRVSFRDHALGTWTSALARDRETRLAFPRVTSLPLPADAGAFLEAYFRGPSGALFQGQPVLLTGASRTGRSTTLRALMDALPDSVRALAAVEEPKGVTGGAIGRVRVGQGMALVQVVRSFLRQDPDFIFADEVRTLEELQLLCNGALTGHAMVCVLEAATPEDGYAWMTEAMPGMPMQSLLVHHTRDATTGALTMSLHETQPTEDGGALRVVPWTPAPPVRT
ncbi:ATPase, T2SS/T4P/T4SS family [Pyxidicoccus xibeiensis]|uniref:ATPase, T2SS/T4P/T4SS family n=1 Tax=Pyxidicoccus xibeiensis TaxID=2906759 RepID=UPI0020A770C4|nr:ATPase, T2SS/T4P/T4SS family [Pyxidicoccus xibeiensis]MCP3140369.1 Flp pilus assembly complex ATPase component TadA [Pyxidicoccus xibeiensis]